MCFVFVFSKIDEAKKQLADVYFYTKLDSDHTNAFFNLIIETMKPCCPGVSVIRHPT